MQQSTTDKLEELLENITPEQLDSYLKSNRDHLADDKKAFYYHIKNTLDEKNIRLKDVYSFAGVSESYGSKIISGEKHTTDRDLILRLCIAGHFNWAEINRALKLYGMNELYAKNPRDACIIVAVNNRKHDLAQIDDILLSRGLPKLSKDESISC